MSSFMTIMYCPVMTLPVLRVGIALASTARMRAARIKSLENIVNITWRRE